MKETYEVPETPKLPSFLYAWQARFKEDGGGTITTIDIEQVHQEELEAWLWENVFIKEHVAEEGAWLYDRMQRTSEILEAAQINKHDFNHVKTVAVNACLIFLATQGAFLLKKYDLSTEAGKKQLFTKLAIVATAGLFHDTGYLECIDDPDDFTKPDLDNHPVEGAEALFEYGNKCVGKVLTFLEDGRDSQPRLKAKVKARQLVEKLLETFFQPAVVETILAEGANPFYKNLRKTKSAISSHDSPDNQGGSDEYSKLDNLSAEACCVYLADKTHIGQRGRTEADLNSPEVIRSDDITLLHDRITHLVQHETFSVGYEEGVLVFNINLRVDIPKAYRAEAYDELDFQQDMQNGFTKRYRHAQKVFNRLMHRENLQNRSTKLVINVDFVGGNPWSMAIAKPRFKPGKGLYGQMKQVKPGNED